MEEELIYELVDCIVNNQDKINELTQNIESPEGNEIYKKEIHYKNNLNANIKRLNKYENEKKLNDKKFQEYTNNFYSKIENIENEIASTSEKLNEFDMNNTNKELYKIPYEKFKNIILNKHDKENLKNMNKEYKKINTNYITISKDMKILDEEKNRLKELNLMLEEEKQGIDLKMVDYISLKESYDEMAKQYLKDFIFENLNINEENIESNNKLNENNEIFINKQPIIILYPYELNIVEFNKIAKEISNQILYLINHYIKATKTDNNDIINVKSYDNMIKSNENKEIVNIIENNNNILFHSIANKTKIYYNKQEINSLISILSSKIEKKIIEFILTSNNYMENNQHIENFDNLFVLINNLIISFINIYFPSFINKKEDNSSLLLLFIKCIMKSIYYQKIMSNDLYFLNKEYKKRKKDIKSNLHQIEQKYNNIKNGKEECLILKNKFEEKMKYLNNNINNFSYNDLTPEEKQYIKLNQKLSDLKTEKKKLKCDFIRYENEINYNLEKLSYKIEDLKSKNKLIRKNILTCKEEIKLKNHQNKLEIDKLEKSIKNKFNVIKGQISVYKKKHGDNIELYNKFVDRINDTLKETDNEINKEINDNNKKDNYISNNNSLYNTQSTFYKSNEKQNIRKYIFTPEKNNVNTYERKTYFYEL